MLLIGAVKGNKKNRVRNRQVWILPHTPGPYTLPRFHPRSGRLYFEINWKKGPRDGLNTQFINALVSAVQAAGVSVFENLSHGFTNSGICGLLQAPATIGVTEETIRERGLTHFSTMRTNYFAQRAQKENMTQ